MRPALNWIRIPPTAPAIPPKPTIEPTAHFGNMSDVVVKMLALNPWCAAAATPINVTATHRLCVIGAYTTGRMQSAQINIAVLRAPLSDQPRLSSDDDSHPPATLPTSVKR